MPLLLPSSLLDKVPSRIDLCKGGLAKAFERLDLISASLGSGQLGDHGGVLKEDELLLFVGFLVARVPFVTAADSSILVPPFGWMVLGELGQLVPVGGSLLLGLDGVLGLGLW